VWVYSQAAGNVSEVDSGSNRVLHATPLSVRPADHRAVIGPVLAADRNGAWIVGVDRRGRGVLTLVPRGGGRRDYVLGGRPVAVAVGLRTIWVLDLGAHADRLLRLDPATGRRTVQARLPVSSRVDTLTYGFGDLWLVSSTTAMLYRIEPRLASVDRVDLGRTAGRPVALLGEVWVDISDDGGHTKLVNPQSLLVDAQTGCCGPSRADGGVGNATAGAFGSVWSYDVGDGEVQRWNPPELAQVIQVTDAPYYDGSCMTSLAASGDAVWVTLAPATNYRCTF
jgi:hypothetical protein